MVGMQVRDKYYSELQGVDAISEHLLLHTLATIDQVKLFIDVNNLPRVMPTWRGLGRRGT